MRYAANAVGLVGAAFRTIMRCLQRLLDASAACNIKLCLFYHAEKTYRRNWTQFQFCILF